MIQLVTLIARKARSLYWRLRVPILKRRAERNVGKVTELIASSNDFFFDELGVDKRQIRSSSAERSRRLGIPYKENMQSVHYLAFEALAASGFAPQNILEVGTLYGYTAAYLSDLFPSATIYTVELPDDDPIFDVHEPLSLEARKEMFKRIDRPNIRLVRSNSAFLFRQNFPKFDLIWQDTNDRFPDIGWEFYASLSLLKPNGLLFVDDVRRPESPMIARHDWYGHVYQTLRYYEARMPSKFRLLLKREDPVLFGMDPKFVAFLRWLPDGGNT